MESFAVASALNPNEVRSRIGVGYTRPAGNGLLALTAAAATPVYGDDAEINLGIGYGMSF